MATLDMAAPNRRVRWKMLALRHIRRGVRDESGMVTVEGAYALAAIVVAIVVSVGAVMAFVAQVRCTDAAREVARLAAAGDRSPQDAGRAVAGSSARIMLSDSGKHVTVDVSTRVRLLPMIEITARAVAAKEPEGEDLVDFAPGVTP